MIVKTSRTSFIFVIALGIVFFAIGTSFFIQGLQGSLDLQLHQSGFFLFFAIAGIFVIFLGIKNIIHPTILLTITPEGFSFALAAGCKDRIVYVPWENIISAEILVGNMRIANNPITQDLRITFATGTVFPPFFNGDSGLQYDIFSNTLTAYGTYLDTPVKTIFDEINNYIR